MFFSSTRVERPRAVGVWLATTSAAPTLGWWAWSGIHLDQRVDQQLDQQLAAGCSMALVLCAAWAWWVVTVVTLECLGHSASPARGVPVWARRLVLAACGTAVLSAGTHLSPALADGPPAHERGVVSLDGLPFPDRPTGGLVPIRKVLAAAHSASSDTVAVHPGDSLWSLAEERWPRASSAEIAAATRGLYDQNRAVIGTDPDLIHPGQHLVVPASLTDRSHA